MNSVGKYSAFFGRQPDIVLDPIPDDPQSPSVCRFPPTKVGFLKRIFTQLPSDCVYITDGMSRQEMPVPEIERRTYPTRIELIALSTAAIVGGNDGRDVCAAILQSLAVIPFRQSIFFGPLQTCDFGERICTNSEMTGFFFAVPDGVDMDRLCRCTPAAQLVVSVIPITPKEIQYAKEKGSEQLISLFEKAAVPNVFDPYRKGVA